MSNNSTEKSLSNNRLLETVEGTLIIDCCYHCKENVAETPREDCPMRKAERWEKWMSVYGIKYIYDNCPLPCYRSPFEVLWDLRTKLAVIDEAAGCMECTDTRKMMGIVDAAIEISKGGGGE